MKDAVATRFRGWKAVVAIVMLSAGAACYILSCVAAMVVIGKE